MLRILGNLLEFWGFGAGVPRLCRGRRGRPGAYIGGARAAVARTALVAGQKAPATCQKEPEWRSRTSGEVWGRLEHVGGGSASGATGAATCQAKMQGVMAALSTSCQPKAAPLTEAQHFPIGGCAPFRKFRNFRV